MKRLGSRQFAIETLVWPGMTDRAAHPDIVERADSIREVGLLYLPMVRISDLHVIAGRDRILALRKMGKKHAMCLAYECTDAEAKQLELTENTQRRHEAGRKTSDLAALVEATVEVLKEKEPDIRIQGSGRGGTLRGRAREMVAASAGVKVETVRRAEWNNNQERPKLDAPPKPLGRPKLRKGKFNDMGMEVDPYFAANIGGIQAYVSKAQSLMRKVIAELRMLDDSNLPIHQERVQRYIKDGIAFMNNVNSLRPFSICPYCKGIETVMKDCRGCE